MGEVPVPAQPLLAVEDLCIWRGDRCLLDGLGFAVGAGELLWLRGDNGVGKTSLLRVLAGLATAERGAVCFRGAPIDGDPAAYRAELLYLGHLDALKRALTPGENLAADAALRSAVPACSVAQALAALGVARCEHLPVAQLSAGQRRRVALARLARSRTALWLLDEPTTNLDADGQRVVAGLLDDHLARGGAAVVASHLPLATARAARSLVLDAPVRSAA
jgi:heme exporter protein A